MKTLIFSSAIRNRNKVKFLYGLNQVVLEPLYICRNKVGKKILYGKITNSNQIRTFEYDRMSNIKVLAFEKFSPIIPIVPIFN